MLQKRNSKKTLNYIWHHARDLSTEETSNMLEIMETNPDFQPVLWTDNIKRARETFVQNIMENYKNHKNKETLQKEMEMISKIEFRPTQEIFSEKNMQLIADFICIERKSLELLKSTRIRYENGINVSNYAAISDIERLMVLIIKMKETGKPATYFDVDISVNKKQHGILGKIPEIESFQTYPQCNSLIATTSNTEDKERLKFILTNITQNHIPTNGYLNGIKYESILNCKYLPHEARKTKYTIEKTGAYNFLNDRTDDEELRRSELYNFDLPFLFNAHSEPKPCDGKGAWRNSEYRPPNKQCVRDGEADLFELIQPHIPRTMFGSYEAPDPEKKSNSQKNKRQEQNKTAVCSL